MKKEKEYCEVCEFEFYKIFLLGYEKFERSNGKSYCRECRDNIVDLKQKEPKEYNTLDIIRQAIKELREEQKEETRDEMENKRRI